MAAHAPYYNGGGRAARWDPSYEGPVAPRKRPLDRIMQAPIPLSPRDVTHLDAVYDAAIRGTDEISGALLEELRRRGLLERTVIVFLADHGEDLYDHHGYLYHACSVYQTTLHVPLGVVARGIIPAGIAIEQTVELIDVLPTVLELLGIEPPAEQHGVSLVPYLADPGTERRGRPAFSEYGDSQIRTVLAGRFKLVNNPQAITPRCMEGVADDFYPIGRTELYDLEADPQERVNLAASRPEKVAELQGLIGRRWARLTNRVRRQELPDEIKKQLRALGYVAD
jgi:arylsulfatase A-like enzyme